MRFISSFLFLIFLASCASTQTVAPVVGVTSTIQPSLEPPSTFVPPTRTVIPSPTTTQTATPIPCEPRAVDFCITDGHFLLQRPMHPPANDSVERTYPFASTAGGTRDPHRGVEFVNALGIPVYAAGEGVVLFAGSDEAAIYSLWRNYYGNLIVLQHEGNLYTLYAHLSAINVTEGDVVEAGEQVGEVGRSGVAIGSHLHFEVRRGDVEDYFSMVNPELWLLPSQPEFGALAISIQDSNSALQKSRITLQQFSASGEILSLNYLNTYHSTLALGEENVGMNDLTAGRYRITFIHNGGFYERWVEVQSGKLTQVVIVVK